MRRNVKGMIVRGMLMGMVSEKLGQKDRKVDFSDPIFLTWFMGLVFVENGVGGMAGPPLGGAGKSNSLKFTRIDSN